MLYINILLCDCHVSKDQCVLMLFLRRIIWIVKRKLPAGRFYRTILCENPNLILSNKYSILLALSNPLTVDSFIIWSDFMTSFKMQTYLTLCCILCHFAGFSIIWLQLYCFLYFNDMKSLTGTVQSCCINDSEQLLLRISMKHHDFLNKIILITESD